MSGRIVTRCLYPMLAVALVSGASLAKQATPVPPAAPADRKPAAATPPAPEPHDLTTPKGALKVLASALRDGDAGRIREVMYATTQAETRMVAAMADMAAAMAQLQKASVKAFGEEGAKEIVGDTQATDAQGRARIDAADVRVAGDTATVIVPEGEDAPVVLKRVGGLWKVPMSEMSKNAEPAALEERLTELGEQRKLVAQLTEEIAQGLFKSPASAKDAWQSRAMQAVTRRPPARKPQPEAKPPEPSANAADASARPASGR